MVSTPEREEPSPSSCRILFVDDNESLRAIIPETVRDAGYIVATADGGKSCLDELCQAEYDLIILDIMMEPMDGWKTLRAIRKDTAYQEIPIVILTGKLFLPAEMITYGTEVAGWIKKPIHMEQFTARIDEIVADLIEDQRIAEEKAAAGILIAGGVLGMSAAGVSSALASLQSSAQQVSPSSRPQWYAGQTTGIAWRKERGYTWSGEPGADGSVDPDLPQPDPDDDSDPPYGRDQE